ncbi:alpha-glucosidase [Sphingomonas humi]|uniref:Alpha-glucosidase n=1 Tax=Sphingomonas humi TaxID=335630 RepID=A0ABP7S939_9SPHN
MAVSERSTPEVALRWERDGDQILLVSGEFLLLRLGPGAAAVGRGNPSIEMYRGNFAIDDSPEMMPLGHAWRTADGVMLATREGESPLLSIAIDAGGGNAGRLKVRTLSSGLDRIVLRFAGLAGQDFYGGGEQMSYLRLNGRRFPIWTSEPGVGRDKSDPYTQAMDASGLAGGDYWTTNYPQPTLIGSAGVALHLDAACYSVIDATGDGAAFEIWQGEAAIEVHRAPTLAGLVDQLSTRFGRQPPLPDWAIGGAIVGLKDGLNSFERLDRMVDAGVAVSGLWCEDWAGIRETSFGRRLFWDWQKNDSRYPDLPARIAELHSRGIRFLAYANPYLCVDGPLFAEAAAGGHLALQRDSDSPYAVDFGEFDAGVVDFTRDESAAWFAERVIGKEMLDIGIDGWMADFGEYLPTDVRLASGEDPMTAHNRWPVLWAEVNARAVASRGRTGDALFFMRAGFSGVQAHCSLLWAGDQSVDFSRHDGINTVITAALSSGLVGNAYSHSDCGGYTSLGHKTRTEELLHRWYELSAFSPVFRTHEGNRPDDNLQVDSNPDLLAGFARWSRVHRHLAPYVRTLCDEAQATGLPAQRPLFLHAPGDRETAGIQDQYLYGRDLMVAPVVEENAVERRVYVPGGELWRDLWSGSMVEAGWHDVPAPLGRPPLFVRDGSAHAELFAAIPDILR